jgi:hypothetical protein
MLRRGATGEVPWDATARRFALPAGLRYTEAARARAARVAPAAADGRIGGVHERPIADGARAPSPSGSRGCSPSCAAPPSRCRRCPRAASSRTPNVLGQPLVFRQAGEAGWGAVDIAYSMGPYRLGVDEALLMEGRFPECLFANVVVWNRFMQTVDYRHRPVSQSRAQTRVEADGSFCMVIAHRDPGVPNWLDTEGHGEGTIFWRFLMPKGEIVRPICRVVPMASLRL